MRPDSEAPSLLPYVGLTANELAFALFLIGLVYLAVSLPALGRLLARIGGGAPEEPRKRVGEKPALPGTRAPDAKPVVSGTAGPTVPKSPSQTLGDAESRSKTPRPPSAQSRPGSVTGGVRAGAPAARPGYGSLAPKPDLNAGIPVPDTSRRAGVPRGGLLPSARGPLAPRPTTPSAPTPRPPRVSADEIGGF
jgi:hypothetical protein